MSFTDEEMERGDYLHDERRDAQVVREINNNRPEDGRICNCEDAPCCGCYDTHNTMTKYKPGTQFRHMLHRQVMVVARIRHDGWKAYCFPVPGQNHDNEEHLWEDEGSQLPEKVARTMFGFLEDLPYAR